MKWGETWWPVVIVAILYAGSSPDSHTETLTAYYADGHRTLYHAEAATQSVATFEINPDGSALYINSGLIQGCHVGDSRNWTCPAVSTGGVANMQYGLMQAIDGEISVTDAKMFIPPISWFRWEFEKVARFLNGK